MDKPLDGFIIFGAELHGFNKEQVAKHFAEIHQKYEKLRQENIRLKKRINSLKTKVQAGQSGD